MYENMHDHVICHHVQTESIDPTSYSHMKEYYSGGAGWITATPDNMNLTNNIECKTSEAISKMRQKLIMASGEAWKCMFSWQKQGSDHKSFHLWETERIVMSRKSGGLWGCWLSAALCGQSLRWGAKTEAKSWKSGKHQPPQHSMLKPVKSWEKTDSELRRQTASRRVEEDCLSNTLLLGKFLKAAL